MKMSWINTRWASILLSALGLLIVLAFWQIAAAIGLLNELLVSTPIDVVGTFRSSFISLGMGHALTVTLGSTAIAFLLAVVLGSIIGYVIARTRFGRAALDLPLWFVYSSPTIAIYPLLLIWIGPGRTISIIVGTLLATTSMAINVDYGFRDCDPNLVKLFQAFGSSRFAMLSKLRLRYALPHIFTGFRISVERALVGVLIAELFAGTAGLGAQLAYFTSRFQTANVMMTIVIIAVVGLVLSLIFGKLDEYVHRGSSQPLME